MTTRILKSRLMISFGILLMLTIFIGGCGGGSDGDGTDNGNANDLIINVLDDVVTKLGLKSAYVTLYTSDNKTILQTIETGDDGIANFGDITQSSAAEGDGRVTVTIAYKDSSQGESEIQTFFDVLPGNFTIYMKDAGCASRGNVSSTYENLPAGAISAIVEPHISGVSDIATITHAATQVTNGMANFSNTAVCAEDLQDDGKLSQLAIVTDNTGSLLSYGYVLDQVFSDGASYTGNANLVPADLNWNTNNSSILVDGISFMAVRKNVMYSMLGIWSAEGTGGPVSSGAFPVANQFPADAYGVQAVQNINAENVKSTLRRFTTFNPDIVIGFTENEFTDFSYDSVNETFSWTLTGNANKDLISVSTKFDATKDVKWNLSLKPEASSLSLPDLPGEVQSWFSRANLSNDRVSIMSVDILDVEGFDAYNIALAAGGDFNVGISGGMDFVSRELIIDGGNAGNGDTGGGDTGGGDTGGGSVNYGSVSFSGTGASSFTNMGFTPNYVVDSGLAGIVWVDADVASMTVFPNPLDSTKAGFVSVTASDGSVWLSSSGTGDVPGVAISGNTVTFNNVTLTGASTITLSGTLTF